MQSSVSLLLAGSLLLATTGLIADDTATIFEQRDRNQDGKLSADELPPHLRERLGTLDKNQNGSIEPAELPLTRQRPASRFANVSTTERQAQRKARDLFAQHDRNQNGRLELQEVPDQLRQMFRRALRLQNQDADDALSLRQLAEALAQIAQQDQTRPGDNRPAPAPQHQADPTADNGPISVRVGALFQTLDANRDGKIDADEIQSAANNLNKLDRNDDGELSIRELLEQTRPIIIPIDRRPASSRRQQD